MSGRNRIPAAPDLEDVVPSSYGPLLDGRDDTTKWTLSNRNRSLLTLFSLGFSILLLVSLGMVLSGGNHGSEKQSLVAEDAVSASDLGPWSRGVSEGVSEKSVRSFLEGGTSYPWTNAMLVWQRTAYHFQPEKNWMNDPDGKRKYNLLSPFSYTSLKK
ncbi:acid beta-fructofuranosidase-like [Magnolia sinica]|uniref:acid beta-fructofuranosidase-like n=1 Tax=Magnolia sinica TaxID=86752 RepID=UPI002657C2C6|nr:acid beta-fructofuranosidase-like [Magnolia sinica]